MQGRKGEWEDGEQSAPKCHQNQNHDGEMTFLGTPNRPSVSHHSWRTCRPMEPKADMCNAGGTASSLDPVDVNRRRTEEQSN